MLIVPTGSLKKQRLPLSSEPLEVVSGLDFICIVLADQKKNIKPLSEAAEKSHIFTEINRALKQWCEKD